MILKDRSAVVTGAGRGIGGAIARALASAGASVLLTARTTDEIAVVADAIRAEGGIAHVTTCDVTSEQSVAQLERTARERLGATDILVNNAGVGHSALLHRTTLDDWNRVLATNATGTFLCTRAFLPGMLERKWGRIINVASVAGLSGQRYISAYTASKHAVIGLTRAGAAEVSGSGVTMNAVCPGFVDTPMTDETVANVARQTGRSAADALALVLATTNQSRLITPEEVALAVITLCDVGAAAINGDALIIDGRDTIA